MMDYPPFKDLHLTVDSWLSQPGEEGWKLPDREGQEHLLGLELEVMSDEELDKLLGKDAPGSVKALPIMKGDSFALCHLFSAEVPPEAYRVVKILSDVFGVGDAFLGGFGSSFARDSFISHSTLSLISQYSTR
jgi:hypothetical protein